MSTPSQPAYNQNNTTCHCQLLTQSNGEAAKKGTMGEGEGNGGEGRKWEKCGRTSSETNMASVSNGGRQGRSAAFLLCYFSLANANKNRIIREIKKYISVALRLKRKSKKQLCLNFDNYTSLKWYFTANDVLVVVLFYSSHHNSSLQFVSVSRNNTDAFSVQAKNDIFETK